MSDPVSGVMGNAMLQNVGAAAGKQPQQNGGGARSFENILHNSGNQQAGENAAGLNVGQPTSVSGAELERMRVDLMQRVGSLPPGSANVNALLPELIDTRTRLGLLKEAMSGTGNTPKGTDLRGQMSKVEGEWNQLEGVMKSGKDLSQGELLGLQARLYQVSQHVEVMSKVVDQLTSGIKTILSTNV
jgi:hypothetical protein